MSRRQLLDKKEEEGYLEGVLQDEGISTTTVDNADYVYVPLKNHKLPQERGILVAEARSYSQPE